MPHFGVTLVFQQVWTVNNSPSEPLWLFSQVKHWPSLVRFPILLVVTGLHGFDNMQGKDWSGLGAFIQERQPPKITLKQVQFSCSLVESHQFSSTQTMFPLSVLLVIAAAHCKSRLGATKCVSNIFCLCTFLMNVIDVVYFNRCWGCYPDPAWIYSC